MKQVGKILLLIAGIALIIIGGWALIAALIGLIGIISGIIAGGDVGTAVLIAGIVTFVVSVLCLLFYLFAGIRGIKTFTKGDAKNINKAFIWAIVILALNIFSLVYSGIAASGIVALVVDVAYITGAFMVKTSK